MTRGKKNERGASAVDYGLIVAAVAAAIILPTQALGVTLGTLFENCSAAIERTDWEPEDPEYEKARRCS